jgi:tetratricopeptide (TPR) repeat protein
LAPLDFSDGEKQPVAVDKAKKFWWAGAVAVPLLVAGVGILPSLLGSKPSRPSINITDSHDLNFHQINLIEQEYRAKVREDLPAELRQQIQQALAYLNQGRFSDGIPILQQAVEKAPVPSLLADLGTALALAGNANDADAAFARAIAEAPDNEAVARGRRYLANAARNNDILSPAEIPIQKTISSTLLDHDKDYFSFTTPSGPRDYIRVTLRNQSTHFYPQLAAFDAQRAPIGGVSSPTGAGGDLTHTFPASPASTHIVAAFPYGSAGGGYTLLVEPMRAFDDYEPNDTIQSPLEVHPVILIFAYMMFVL